MKTKSVFDKQMKKHTAITSKEKGALKAKSKFSKFKVGDVPLLAFFGKYTKEVLMGHYCVNFVLECFPARDAWKIIGNWDVISNGGKYGIPSFMPSTKTAL